MKARGAAALALVGWYLMFAPSATDGTPNVKAPLRVWDLAHSYDKAAECEDEALKSVRPLVDEWLKKHPNQWPPCRGGDDPLCIATDDLRLAK
jgi:hypothetical protein